MHSLRQTQQPKFRWVFVQPQCQAHRQNWHILVQEANRSGSYFPSKTSRNFSFLYLLCCSVQQGVRRQEKSPPARPNSNIFLNIDRCDKPAHETEEITHSEAKNRRRAFCNGAKQRVRKWRMKQSKSSWGIRASR